MPLKSSVSIIGQIDISGRAVGIIFAEIIGLKVDKEISGVLPGINKFLSLTNDG
jgi:hypothetical protein